MKQFKYILCLVAIGMLLASCVTARKVNYMQEPDKHIPSYADTLSFEDYQLRVGDRLYVYVYSLDENVAKMYNAGGTGSSVRQQMTNNSMGGSYDLYTYLVFNNYRPYLIAGINPMLNLTSKSQDYIQLRRYDTMVELGFGCDFYLPFFKLIPELKFSYSLTNSLDTHHSDGLTDANARLYTNSVSSGHAKMITLTFYFE